jgi:hypothetical protein
VKLTLAYDRNGQGYLQSLALQTRRILRRYDEPFLFRSLESARFATVRYLIQQASATMQVWDVTNRQGAVSMSVTINDKQEGSLSAVGNRLREYLVFFAGTGRHARNRPLRLPTRTCKSRETPDLLIITPASWRTQAERLADFRRRNDQT